MRILETQFTKYGHLFTQVVREGNKALYERTLNGRRICFELIRIRYAKARTMPSGHEITAREVYPSSEEFGQYGWSLIYCSLDKAMARFHSLPCPPQFDESTQNCQTLMSNQKTVAA